MTILILFSLVAMIFFKLVIALSVTLFKVTASFSFSEPVRVEDVNLNRVATVLTSDELSKFPNATLGFIWNSEDENTLKWRPQGVSGITNRDGNEYMIATWYGRSQENYDNRGVRISLVDVTDMSANSKTLMYRHILLVDEDFNTFPGLHGGGVVFEGSDTIHVPDSRGGNKKIFTFSTDKIYSVPEEERDKFYNYAYIMVRVSSYDVPITPSFLSYDWNKQQILLGTFYQCDSVHTDTDACLSNTNNRLTWYGVNESAIINDYCTPFFSEMQGAGSSKNPKTSEDILWTTSSYGSGHSSHLHINSIPSNMVCNTNTKPSVLGYRVIEYPPGLEDMYITSPDSQHPDMVWIITEFGTNDGTGNKRTVFATPILDILPY